jgi:hypothetical protein
MKKLVSLLFVVLALAAAGAYADGEVSTEPENALLAQVLKHNFNEPGYTVVWPEAEIAHMGGRDAAEIAQSKKYVLEQLRVRDAALPGLVDKLFERNKSPVRLTLKSAQDDGYIIDDGTYAKYFEHGGGWEKWYADHPAAHGATTVSIPVLDEKSGLLLVYVGTQRGWLEGAGFMLLYRKDKDGLHELARVMMWIS